MRHMQRAIAIVILLVLVTGLFGCSFGAPVTTEELLLRYVANENVDNFSAKVGVDLSVTALGVHASVPVTANLRAADNKAHGTIEVDLSALNTRNYTMEVYGELNDDSMICYIGVPDGDAATWKCWTIDMTSSIDIFTVTELLSSSELTKIAKDSDPKVSYELTVPTAKVLETVFDVTAGTAEVGGMDEQGMMDTVGDDKVRVDFTKDCLMRSLTTGVLADFKSPETNNVPVKIGMDVSATLDAYGEIDPQSVVVPSEVRDSATPTDAPVNVTEIIGADSPLAGAVKQ